MRVDEAGEAGSGRWPTRSRGSGGKSRRYESSVRPHAASGEASRLDRAPSGRGSSRQNGAVVFGLCYCLNRVRRTQGQCGHMDGRPYPALSSGAIVGTYTWAQGLVAMRSAPKFHDVVRSATSRPTPAGSDQVDETLSGAAYSRGCGVAVVQAAHRVEAEAEERSHSLRAVVRGHRRPGVGANSTSTRSSSELRASHERAARPGAHQLRRLRRRGPRGDARLVCRAAVPDVGRTSACARSSRTSSGSPTSRRARPRGAGVRLCPPA